MWMAHNDNIAQRMENSPSTVRLYLNQTRDYDALRWWDNRNIKDSAEKGGDL
jgi:hypothetical protein